MDGVPVNKTWEFWIDVGGTFTDCLARRPDGTITEHNLIEARLNRHPAERSSKGTLPHSDVLS